MTYKHGLSDAELELELLHGLLEDCSDPESNVSDEDLSLASDSDKDCIPPALLILIKILNVSNCFQPESGNATSEVCVTTFHKENGARPSFDVGSRHVGKGNSTIWTVTAHNINTQGGFSAQSALCSTQHSNVGIGTGEKQLPKTIQYRNSTKYGVDVVGHMSRKYTVRTACRRWPVHVFFNILDLAGINA
ncbi:hypothetical protein ILUMI_04375 [Ignelater luminosus]|uniref:PiggyBac transposable element-derived protein domain-containing protein n=1 Tax=Ignelater luminosus TaxID=2038154 RepID=A0A8K0DCZ8_IGNLU|nr:hypothetical protein ILUMI_04375 [Ignelater luminosus]